MAFSSSSSLGNFNALPLSNEPFVRDLYSPVCMSGTNTPQTTYGPNTSEREALKQALKDVEAGAPYEVFPNVNGSNVSLHSATHKDLSSTDLHRKTATCQKLSAAPSSTALSSQSTLTPSQSS
jgi:hypothetical protein